MTTDLARRLGWLTCALAAAFALPAHGDATRPPTHQEFTLYKFQNPIGIERTIDDGRELRAVFSFTDRWDTVPLAATLERGKDGTPVRFALWGNTSRPFSVDDRVEVAAGKLTITQRGVARTLAAPATFFVGSAYAPVTMTQELVRYWLAHGLPARLPVYPIGDVAIVRRGDDVVEDRDHRAHTLTRYAIAGLGWGGETVWLDDQQQLVAVKAVDTEFDHFEATARAYNNALPTFIARAAEDGLAAFAEASRTLRADGDAGDAAVAYVHARLVDGTNAPPVADAAVVVDHGKIVAAGATERVRIPDGVRRVDVAGATIVPGLWDMHAHFEQVEWGPVYLAAGVTTVRDCGNELPFIRAVRDTIAAGKGVGPRVMMACIVDGDSGGAIGVDRLRTADQIPALIKKFQDAGCAQVKIYQSFPPALIHPLSLAAHAAGMTVTGHVPNGTDVFKAIEAGEDMISHLPFVLDAMVDTAPEQIGSPRAPTSGGDRDAHNQAIAAFDPNGAPAHKLAAWLVAHHAVLDPTLSVYELSLPRSELARNEPGLAKLPAPLAAVFSDPGPRADADFQAMRFAKLIALAGTLHKAGVTIMAGTDQTVPGHSLHRELELYVQAGFTPLEALQAATIVPARVMKRDKELGTVEAGKRADFVIVDGDPLADIRALRKIRIVVSDGKAYDPAKLWQSVGFKP
jgi:imidazolonepropionase-like amidohydrolase